MNCKIIGAFLALGLTVLAGSANAATPAEDLVQDGAAGGEGRGGVPPRQGGGRLALLRERSAHLEDDRQQGSVAEVPGRVEGRQQALQRQREEERAGQVHSVRSEPPGLHASRLGHPLSNPLRHVAGRAGFAHRGRSCFWRSVESGIRRRDRGPRPQSHRRERQPFQRACQDGAQFQPSGCSTIEGGGIRMRLVLAFMGLLLLPPTLAEARSGDHHTIGARHSQGRHQRHHKHRHHKRARKSIIVVIIAAPSSSVNADRISASDRSR